MKVMQKVVIYYSPGRLKENAPKTWADSQNIWRPAVCDLYIYAWMFPRYFARVRNVVVFAYLSEWMNVHDS